MATDFRSALLGQAPEETDRDKLRRLAFELLGLLQAMEAPPTEQPEVRVVDRVLPYTA